MAAHVWNQKTYGESAVGTILAAYRTARRDGLGFVDACRFAGYALESIRQKGQASGGYGSPNRVWQAALLSRHRYAKGHNAGNYELAGRRVLCQHLRDSWAEEIPSETVRHLYTALYDGGPGTESVALVLADACEESGDGETARLLRGI